MTMIYFFFFFQAEDGIRDGRVTGVQTCASSDLTRRTLLQFGQHLACAVPQLLDATEARVLHDIRERLLHDAHPERLAVGRGVYSLKHLRRDRKSTRLNSSHPSISYAVFCLKKKK